MIILKNLRWSNCFSYASNNELALDSSVVTQIVGINGAGKSSIPLILEEVLYNKNSKGVKKSEIQNKHIGDKSGYSMGLDFSVDNDEYSVDLVRKAAIKVKLVKNGEDISSHTATNTFKNIEEILGVDFKTFSQLVYQSTSGSLQFLTATDTTRKRFLIELLGLDKYVEYFEIFKTLSKEYNSKIISITSSIDTLEKWLLDNNLGSMIVLSPIKLDIDTEKEEKALANLLSEFENISSINKKISKNNNYREQLANIDLNSIPLVDGVVESYDNYTEVVGTTKNAIKHHTAIIEKFKKLGSTCPTCNQKVPDEVKNQIIVLESRQIGIERTQQVEAENAIKIIKTKNALIEQRQKAERDFQTLFKAIDTSLPIEPLEASTLQEKINDIEKVLADKKAKIKSIIEENNRITKNNTKIQVIEEQTESIRVKLEAAKEELAAAQKISADIEVLKKAFSTNGLLAYKIEYLVKELEVLVNEYLSELSDGRFTLLFVVLNDKLNVNITDNGKEVDIQSLSSGELARVNTSTLLAIRRLMNSISKSQINVLFLDEVISVLDEQGRERLVDVLIKEDKLNTFIVSHQWSHPLLSKLDIVKENNISRIEENG